MERKRWNYCYHVLRIFYTKLITRSLQCVIVGASGISTAVQYSTVGSRVLSMGRDGISQCWSGATGVSESTPGTAHTQ